MKNSASNDDDVLAIKKKKKIFVQPCIGFIKKQKKREKDEENQVMAITYPSRKKNTGTT